MAFAKIQKQLNIANQLITEKVFNGEKSKFNDDFTEMERKTDATAELIEDLQQKTKEFLQPNPAARAKMAALKLSSSGQAKSQYPQTEGILGAAMVGHGKKLGEDDSLGQALIEAGDSLKQIADVKYSLDNNIKQNFLEPLNHLQNNDLKEVMHHRKKLSNRRLDYDGKRRKQTKGGITDDEVRTAQEKFKESLHNASTSMYHLLENDVETISQLCVFAESLAQYYQSCSDIMQDLTNKLFEKKNEALSRPKKEFIPTSLSDLNIDSISMGSNGDRHNNNANGGRLNNLSRSTSKSSFNLASYQKSHNNSNGNFSRASKMYGSQSNLSGISMSSSSQNVNNFNINSPTSYNLERWEQAWEDNNNNYRPPSHFQPNQQREHSFEKSNKHSHPTFNRSNSINQSTTSNRSMNYYVDDPFDDPWSPVKPTISNPIPMNSTQSNQNANLINSFNNNYRMQSSGFPHCIALYDFEAENPGELSFKENDMIRLVNKVDENWYEGSVNGRSGYFPQSYVQVKIPLP